MQLRIVKYENRKFYNTETARYVSMLDLSELVAERGDVVVVSDRTGEDVTLLTLCHVLYAGLKAGAAQGSEGAFKPFSPSVLIRLIQKTRDLSSDSTSSEDLQ